MVLCIESTNKILRKDTALSVINEMRNRGNSND